eukprot:CAMPEP_0175897708 /NCGR_PEP_ID=MMETSP0108-20121206/861_1 /TAXON_ID=195067 ORGANISM="Goniomonas pacifica, Strain CCMP1869" /NCGR_SAMPLE_ID=MMETSP0108 /ASSEMBLY_ACC=CAM_ASM_000204 /LENGTH=46 /DNA_ID= /DNA_START= /DNA_END= /DNA_ORIENTATION=
MRHRPMMRRSLRSSVLWANRAPARAVNMDVAANINAIRMSTSSFAT